MNFMPVSLAQNQDTMSRLRYFDGCLERAMADAFA